MFYPDSILNVIKKGLRLILALTQNNIKFFRGNKDIDFVFYFVLIFFLLEQMNLFEKKNGK